MYTGSINGSSTISEVVEDNRNCIRIADDFYDYNNQIDLSWWDNTKTYKVTLDAKYVNNGSRYNGQFDFMILSTDPVGTSPRTISGTSIPQTSLRNEAAFNAISQDWFHREAVLNWISTSPNAPKPQYIAFGYSTDNSVSNQNFWYVDKDTFKIEEVESVG